MSHSFKDRNVLITGATSGIGEAIALAFGRAGATVLVSGRDVGRGESSCDAIRAAGSTARFLPADLADPAAAAQLARAARDVAGGRIDILVHAAGAGAFQPSADVTGDDWDRIYAVNARAPFFLTAAIAPGMAERGRGAVVSICSAGTTDGLSGLSLFNSAKSALKAMSTSWAAEYGPSGVNVNVIDVGGVRTPINAAMRDFVEAIAAKTPAARMVEPEKVAGAVLFLASDEASHIHGVTLPVDGGYTITAPLPG